MFVRKIHRRHRRFAEAHRVILGVTRNTSQLLDFEVAVGEREKSVPVCVASETSADKPRQNSVVFKTIVPTL